jgi:hypothetical protein
MVPRGGRGALIARLRFPGQSRHVPEGHTSPRCVERVSSHGTSCRRTSAIDGLFQERRRRTPGTWRRWTDEQRKICTSVIDAAVDGCCLCYESYVNPRVQDTVRRCLSDIETIGMLDRKCTLRVFNLHTMTACLDEVHKSSHAASIPRTSTESGAGRSYTGSVPT